MIVSSKSVPAPICLGCTRFRADKPGLTCDAFPQGIPQAIYESSADHRKPYPGDRNLQFVAKTPADAEYAAELFTVPAS